MSTGYHGLPGKPEDVLGEQEGYLLITQRLLNCDLHSYRLLPPPDRRDRIPVEGDRDFGEDIELKHYVTAEEKMESGATNFFLRYMWKALALG